MVNQSGVGNPRSSSGTFSFDIMSVSFLVPSRLVDSSHRPNQGTYTSYGLAIQKVLLKFITEFFLSVLHGSLQIRLVKSNMSYLALKKSCRIISGFNVLVNPHPSATISRVQKQYPGRVSFGRIASVEKSSPPVVGTTLQSIYGVLISEQDPHGLSVFSPSGQAPATGNELFAVKPASTSARFCCQTGADARSF